LKILTKFFIFFLLFSFSERINAKSWCKAVYNQNILPGELQKQINKCRNSDNFFLAIHSSYKNAGHLLNSFVAEYCDLNRRLLRTEPREGDPFFTIVCEFRKSNLRE
tara:strand:+ start:555 stop:875 length:321 start_codon:yes stop_codon:yes gene_type:complete